MSAKVLVIGSGGREHTLAWKLLQSPQVKVVFVAPGNAGTQDREKITNIDVDIKDFSIVAQWCKDNDISLVVVGPEDPLANGIGDVLRDNGILVFGPSGAAAQIEASKEFAKKFMTTYKIPTAQWQSFTNSKAAVDFINGADFPALVVKASGLAAGKGVIVAKDKEEACNAVKEILEDKKFGAAGSTVVIEELLEGEEVSCLAFTDGKTIASFPPAQDHKRIMDGDHGLNTGGMGAYCPCPLVSKSELEVIEKEILQKAVDGMKDDGKPYTGVLYAGLMLTKDGPRCLEFNCRFGDPETQVLLPLLETDIFSVMKKCATGDLGTCELEFSKGRHAVAVMTVSKGYPGSYAKGFPITGIETVEKDQLVFHSGTAMKGDTLVTSGGRVLSVVAIEDDLATAARQAQLGAAAIQFEGKFYRKDIAHKSIKQKQCSLSYKDSGVNIGAGDRLVEDIKPLAAATSRTGCTADLGMFGGLFDLKAAGYTDPLLVSGTDGVGTKLKIAQLCGIHTSVGEDLVAMCVNDILCHGAEPLFFLDYFACGKLEVGVAKDVIHGVTNGCKVAGCALLGGETAEMPGMYNDGDYDLAGFTVGAVNRENYLPHINDIVQGDVILGITSSGLHSNGFSLVRKIIEHCQLNLEDPSPWEEEKSLGTSLLTPTKIYVKSVLPILQEGKVKAVAHITGGGLPGNLCRILPQGVAVTLDALSWQVPPVFGWLMSKGNVDPGEMAKTFNCGIGLALVVAEDDKDTVTSSLVTAGETAIKIGTVTKHTKGEDLITINNLETALDRAWQGVKKHRHDDTDSDIHKRVCVNGIVTVPVVRKKVGVLISGSGTNLQALIDYTQKVSNHSAAEIVLVISNKPGVEGLKRAERAGIPTQVIPHKDFKSREEFDGALQVALQAAGVEIVCLAGFMRILTGGFTRAWEGRMLNVHPSLLPSFKGGHAHKLVLEAGVRISGCTVHFVTEEVDAGAILVQESVPVYPTDTEDTLAERVKTKEHTAFPQALELVASNQARLNPDGKVVWNVS